ncbi:hypothetical protein JTE90_024951 [Oedothorax gibbosus]|uniref:Uncharacterized protein n=1 Tax=Oedothorax gibbosus TaxID=931172 RepID=A0AAV6VVQ2_9ARAC|nr:hypothetical protein JTE90_024951 [Oedothorax gibbosus]
MMFEKSANNKSRTLKMSLKTGKIKKIRSVKNKKKFSNSKILKMMFHCLFFKRLSDVISWKDEKKGQFQIKFMNKNNPRWHESMLSLFKMSESEVSTAKSLKYSEEKNHNENTKCRFRSSLNGFVNRKNLEFLGIEKKDNSNYRIYQFVNYGEELRSHLLKKATEEKGRRKKIKKGDKPEVSMQVSIVPVISKEISHYLCLSSQISKLESGNQIFKFFEGDVRKCGLYYVASEQWSGSGLYCVASEQCPEVWLYSSPQSSEPGSEGFITLPQSSVPGSVGFITSPQSSVPGSVGFITSPQSSEPGSEGFITSPQSSVPGSVGFITSPQSSVPGSVGFITSPQSSVPGSAGFNASLQSSGPESAGFISSPQSGELGSPDFIESLWSTELRSVGLIASPQSRELGSTGSTASTWSSRSGSPNSIPSPQSSGLASDSFMLSYEVGEFGSESLIVSPQSSELGSTGSAVSPQSNEFENGWASSSNCCEFSNGFSPESYSSTSESFESLSKDILMDEEHGNTENDDSNAISGDSNPMLPIFNDLNMFVRTVSVSNDAVMQPSPLCYDMNLSNLYIEDLEKTMDTSFFYPAPEDLTKLKNMDPSVEMPLLGINEENFEGFNHLGLLEEKDLETLEDFALFMNN